MRYYPKNPSAATSRCPPKYKYDPIPMADYYSLYGVFASSREPKPADTPLVLTDAEQPVQPVVFLRGNPANPGP